MPELSFGTSHVAYLPLSLSSGPIFPEEEDEDVQVYSHFESSKILGDTPSSSSISSNNISVLALAQPEAQESPANSNGTLQNKTNSTVTIITTPRASVPRLPSGGSELSHLSNELITVSHRENPTTQARVKGQHLLNPNATSLITDTVFLTSPEDPDWDLEDSEPSVQEVGIGTTANDLVALEEPSSGKGSEKPGSLSNSKRPKRSVVHLHDMVVCATGCNPLLYKGYGCYCGFLGSGLTVDGIDR
jgi:hypothetical protein